MVKESIDRNAVSAQNIHNAIADFVIEIEQATTTEQCRALERRLIEFRDTFHALEESCFRKAVRLR